MKKTLLIVLTICTFNIQSQTPTTGVLNTDSLLLQKRIYDLEQQVNTLNNMFGVINKNQTINFTILKERNKTSQTLMFIGFSSLVAGVARYQYDKNKLKKNNEYKPNYASPILLYGGGIFLTATFILDIDNLKWVSNQYRHNNKIESKNLSRK